MFFYPLNIQTRFSMGVVALHFILLTESGGFYKKLIPWSALFIFAERLLCFIFLDNLSLVQGMLKGYPIMLYYISFMCILKAAKFNKRSSPERMGILLLADAASNMVELIVRGEISLISAEYILIVSLIRISAAAIIYLIYRYRVMIITDEIHQEKYISLNLLVSSLEAELFYLKKSTGDIEDVMKKAHALYLNEKNNPSTRDQCLDIAREVHEIKKDYLRITQGMECHLMNFKKGNTLPLKKLKEIITSSTLSHIKGSQREISFSMGEVPDIILKDYHKLFILINNLIVNSIDAISDWGSIIVTCDTTDDLFILEITDTGKGISQKNIPLLFNPGFTTKYHKVTGEMNTGLGLSHVKNILDDLGGTIEVKSTLQVGTTFHIEIPLAML